MTIRTLILLLLLVTLSLITGSVDAQQPKKVPRIGYLSSFDAANESTRAEAIRLALREPATLRDRLSPSSTDMGGEA